MDLVFKLILDQLIYIILKDDILPAVLIPPRGY